MKINPDQLTLYHFTTCPFCLRVRMAIKQLGLKIQHKNIHQDGDAHAELLAGGGRGMVPCLRIDPPDGEPTWMYESADIVHFLRDSFGT